MVNNAPQNFQPQLSEKDTQQHLKRYADSPYLYTSDEVTQLENHSNYYGMSFYKEHNDGLIGIIEQAASGFMSGASTLEIGPPPDSTAESIARNVGHLAGFAGMTPAAPLKALGATRLAAGLAKYTGKWSVPMIAANAAERQVKKLLPQAGKIAINGRADATKAAASFLTKAKVKDVAQGAFHLGVASAVSSWQGGVDQMLHAAIGGAQAGGVFRLIGNLIKVGDPQGDKLLRGVAGSLFTGLPATARGATTPEQVYEYLLGAYFGYKETPVEKKIVGKHLKKMNEEGTFSPEQIKGWENYPADIQKKIKDKVDSIIDKSSANILGNLLVKGMDKKTYDKIIKANTPEGFEMKGIDEATGEPILKLTPEAKKLEKQLQKESKQDFANENPAENAQESEFTGTSTQQILQRTVNFVERKFGDTLKEITDVNEKAVQIKKISEKIDFTVEEFVDPEIVKPKHTERVDNTSEIINKLRNELKVDFKLEDEGFIRQHVLNRLYGVNSTIISAEIGSDGTMNVYTLPNNVTKMGNKRGNREPIKAVEYAFMNAFTRKNGKEWDIAKSRPLSIHDHFIMRDAKGKTIELEFGEYHKMLERNFEKPSDALKAYEKATSEVMNQMYEKGFFYLGGRGDNKRNYFVRKHPDLNRVDKKNLKNRLNVAYLKQGNKGFSKAYTSFRNQWAKTWGKEFKNPKEVFDEIFANNILYEAEINGMPLEANMSNVGTLIKKGFVNNPIGINKRNQIWLTNGVPGNTKFVKERLGLEELSFKILPDAPPKKGKGKDTKASEYVEATDGAILVSDKVLDTLTEMYGLGEGMGSKQNNVGQLKSFIISQNPELGALLGKYMMHSAGPELSKQMEAEGIHMTMYESAVKQMGNRKFNEIYTLKAEDIKGVLSERTDSHSLEPQRIPKQMFSNLTSFSMQLPNQVKSQKVIDKMFNEFIQNSFTGSEYHNNLLAQLRKNPGNKNLLEEVMNNLEMVGVNELMAAIKDPNNTEFASRAYQKMFKIAAENIDLAIADGELNASEGSAMSKEITQFRTILERMANNSESGKLGPYLHKYSLPMLNAVKRAFVVTKVTRPKVKNSIAARMRPYDAQLRKELPELEFRDDIFYLDNGFREMKVDFDIVSTWKRGDRTLGKLWDKYSAGEWKKSPEIEKKVEKFLESVSMRVPMDNPSGANVLKFKGFTNRKGHGILLHPRSMRSQGGADLDGDKSWVFFGWKPEYKKLYQSHKEEFYNPDGTIPDAKQDIVRVGKDKGKKTYRELFLKEPSKFEKDLSKELGVEPNELYKQDILKFFPNARKEASEGASIGRDMLGPAVVLKNVMQAAHGAVMKMTDKTQYIKGETKNGNEYVIELKAKEDPKDWDNFKRLSRAMIALSSDPMDEAGLRGYETFLNKSANALFNIKGHWGNGKPMDNVSPFMVMRGVYGLAANVNRAYWGKNRFTDKKYTNDEMKDLVTGIREMPNEQANSYLFKVGKILEPVDFHEGVFNRISEKKLLDLYSAYSKTIRDLGNNELFKKLREAVGGTEDKFKVPKSKTLDFTFRNKLWSSSKRREVANDDMLFDVVSKAMKLKDNKNWKELKDDIDWRKLQVDRFYQRMEDFIINDITDMASFRNLWEIVRNPKNEINMDMVNNIANVVDGLKKDSYLASIRNKEALKTKEKEINDPDMFLFNKHFKRELSKKELPASSEVETKGEPISQSMTQAQIDAQIIKIKSRLSEPEIKLFDAMMLGSVTTDVNRTATSALGFSSTAIPDASVKRFMNKFNNIFELTENKKLEQQGRTEVEKLAETTKDTAVEDPTEIIDELAPFRGLKSGKLKTKDWELLNRIKDNLNHFHNIVGRTIELEAQQKKGTLKENINPFLRGIMNKDINAMNMQDWRTVDRMLEDFRRGPVISQIYRKITNNSKEALPKWWWWAFPRTVSRDMMRTDLKLIEKEGIFFTEKGIKTKKGSTGKVLEPMTTLGNMQEQLQAMNDASSKIYINLRNKFDKDFEYLDGISKGDALWELAIRNMELGNIKLIQKEYGDKPDIARYYIKNYRDALSKAQDKYDWKNLQNEVFNLPSPDGKGRRDMTTQEVLDNIVGKIAVKNKEFWEKSIRGNKKYLTEFAAKNKTGDIIWHNKEANDPVLDVNKFIKFMQKNINEGKTPPEDMGIDFLRRMSRQMMINTAHKFSETEYLKFLLKNPIKDTGQLPFESYYPHLMMDRKTSKENVKKTYDIIMNDKSLSSAEKLDAVKKLVMKHHNNTGEWTMEMSDNEHWNAWDSALEAIAQKKGKKEVIKHLDIFNKPGNLHSRSGHNPGWNIEPAAYHSYIKGVTDSYYRQLSQIMARSEVEGFYYRNNKRLGSKLTNAWQNFLSLYAQDSMGYPSVIPRSVYENPTMNLKGTPYKAFADNVVVERLNKIKKQLGIKSKEQIPEELKELTVSDIRNWTNLEAKFELMSLLAHPKTAIGNIYGGTSHTITSTGLENFKLGRNLGWLKTHFNPKFEKKEDIDAFVESHGINEEFLIKEANFNPASQTAKVRDFIKDATAKIKRDPEFSDSSLMGLAKKYGISDSIFNKAAWFMRKSERALRRDAFMAHLVQAWRNFGSNLPFDHPVLIKMAKKGVQSTQFLYSAPFRPAFSRTALGKMMTRFQLWGWNAVDFRKEVYRQASIRGFKEGTMEFDRLRRLMTADMVSLALGTVFSYSLFEAALPAPWNWVQDTADWVFGDEKERDRAFFGQWPRAVAPLQMITPPVLRLPVQSFNALINGSWDKVATYTIPSMLPFGRMGRDAVGLYQNPMFYTEKLTGFPILQLQREVKREREREKTYTKGLFR